MGVAFFYPANLAIKMMFLESKRNNEQNSNAEKDGTIKWHYRQFLKEFLVSMEL